MLQPIWGELRHGESKFQYGESSRLKGCRVMWKKWSHEQNRVDGNNHDIIARNNFLVNAATDEPHGRCYNTCGCNLKKSIIHRIIRIHTFPIIIIC